MTNTMIQSLKISTESFYKQLPELIKSGVTFKAKESIDNDMIIVEFSGGY